MFDNGGVTRDICKMVDKNNLTEVETKKKKDIVKNVDVGGRICG